MNQYVLEDIKNLDQVKVYLEKGNEFLGVKGYTDHGLRHAGVVSKIAYNILHELKYPKRTCELAEIAGYLHDIGNFVSRDEHGQTGAIIAMRILEDLKMPYDEVATIVSAIGNHEETNGQIISEVSAALILADKSDVHRSRVRNRDKSTFDIHDRVNFASQKSALIVKNDKDGNHIVLDINIDTSISQVMEYFEIFLTRMVMCRRAAEFLNARFNLVINKYQLL
ncbi:HD domain-containing protein [Clostridium sp. 'deep sea']|uniref:HD domain-containing protein n=1 Tax=Clostridium sp. 'deep sea' TaxID=2779445 RepID=UPI00189675B1|nr:HD domain-containing protein [Clostridium sp. 'deep sea']QOR36251.1 HD domain-containing protein [Clostridium sp. 'deep sea']